MTEPEHDANTSSAARVLLVDDDAVNLLLTAVALRERGFEVVEVNDGAMAPRPSMAWTLWPRT